MAEMISLRAIWGGRVDQIDTQADMFYQLWTRLANINPVLDGDWLINDGFDNMTYFDNPTDLAQQMEEENGLYLFDTKPADTDDGWPPYLHLKATLGQPHNRRYGPANFIHLFFEAGLATDSILWSNSQLLELGVPMVKAMVDTWHPDACCLRSSTLLNARPRSLDTQILPDIGYVTWLSNHIVDPDQLPDAPIRYPYANGTLIGVNTTNPNPLEDALTLADTIYQSGILKPLPDQQH